MFVAHQKQIDLLCALRCYGQYIYSIIHLGQSHSSLLRQNQKLNLDFFWKRYKCKPRRRRQVIYQFQIPNKINYEAEF